MTHYTPTADWRQIDTMTDRGRVDLGIEIAKRLGWRVEPTNLVLFAGRRDVWDVIPPLDGERMAISKTMLITELDAWRYCFKQPQLYGLGDWPNDLNAAFNLPIATACDMSATHHPQAFDENARYSASISWYTPNDDGTHTLNTYSEWDVSPALVLCKAWLAWHDASTLGA